MAFKLAIGNVIDFPVHIKLRDGEVVKDFKFHLQAKRIDAPQAREVFSNTGEFAGQTTDEFLMRHITGWRGQTLVVNEQDGTPAPFGTEALAAMLTVPGAANTVYMTYIKAAAASDGSEGIRKN